MFYLAISCKTYKCNFLDYNGIIIQVSTLSFTIIVILCCLQKGLTPLHDACLECHSDIVLLLLSFGAHIMARSKVSVTCYI